MNLKLKNKTVTFFIKTINTNTFFSLIMESSINIPLIKVTSCGHFGFKNREKETPLACSILANKNAIYALQNGAEYVHIIFKGINIFKKIIISTILKTKYKQSKLKILSITDKTQYPHNGCRYKKIKKR